MDEIDYNSIKNSDVLGSYTISIPKNAWKCELVPNTYWQCEEGKQPNAFHRWMQRLCFGFKWSRIND